MSNSIFISEEDLATIQNMAACNYGPSEIALQLGVKKKSFLALFHEQESEVRQAYDSGKLSTTFLPLDISRAKNITYPQAAVPRDNGAKHTHK